MMDEASLIQSGYRLGSRSFRHTSRDLLNLHARIDRMDRGSNHIATLVRFNDDAFSVPLLRRGHDLSSPFLRSSSDGSVLENHAMIDSRHSLRRSGSCDDSTLSSFPWRVYRDDRTPSSAIRELALPTGIKPDVQRLPRRCSIEGSDPVVIDDSLRPERTFHVIQPFGVQLLPSEPRTLITTDHVRDERLRKITLVVERRSDRRDRILPFRQFPQPTDRLRPSRDHQPRLFTETQTEHQVRERLSSSWHRRRLIHPSEVMLRSTESLRFIR